MRVPIAPAPAPAEIMGAPHITYRLRRFRPVVLVIPAVLMVVATVVGVVLAVIA